MRTERYNAKSNASGASRFSGLKVLLFDLGDTLVQYYLREEFPPLLRAGIQAVRRSLRRAGHEVPSDSESERVVAAENHEARNYRVRPLHKRLGRIFRVANTVSDEEWLPICRAFLDPIFAVAKIYEETLSALDDHLADGYRIGILSNCPWGAPSQPWFEELHLHGLSTRSEVAIFCSDMGWRKPAQPMFRRALAHFACKPEECLIVGDNPRWDTLGARRAKMTSVLIDRTGQTEVSSDLAIRSLLDLKPILKRLRSASSSISGELAA